MASAWRPGGVDPCPLDLGCDGGTTALFGMTTSCASGREIDLDGGRTDIVTVLADDHEA